MKTEDIQSDKFQQAARWILVGTTTVSWILSVASLASCSWVQINDGVRLGLFSRSLSDGGCQSYDSAMDGAHGAARFFAVVTNLALFLSLCGQIFTAIPGLIERFASSRSAAWVLASNLLATAAASNLLTFVFYASRWKSAFCDFAECKSGAAAVLSILNVFAISCGAAVARWIVIAPDESKENLDKKEAAQLISEEQGQNGKTEEEEIKGSRDGDPEQGQDGGTGNDETNNDPSGVNSEETVGVQNLKTSI